MVFQKLQYFKPHCYDKISKLKKPCTTIVEASSLSIIAVQADKANAIVWTVVAAKSLNSFAKGTQNVSLYWFVNFIRLLTGP